MERFLPMGRMLTESFSAISSEKGATTLPPLRFRVEFYVENFSVLVHPHTRHLYYLQVRSLHSNCDGGSERTCVRVCVHVYVGGWVGGWVGADDVEYWFWLLHTLSCV
jgi:hypothetical protein